MPLPLSKTSAGTQRARGGPRRPTLPPLLPLPLGPEQVEVSEPPVLLRSTNGHCVQRVELLLLLLLPPLLVLLLLQCKGLREEEPQGAPIAGFSRRISQRRHTQERNTSSHTRSCLRPAAAAQRHPTDARAARPTEELRTGHLWRCASRATPPPSAPPPLFSSVLERCGGEPSPAPCPPSYGRDGAMLGAGDPSVVWLTTHPRVQP